MTKRPFVRLSGEPKPPGAHQPAFVKGGLPSTDTKAVQAAGVRTTHYFGVKGAARTGYKNDGKGS